MLARVFLDRPEPFLKLHYILLGVTSRTPPSTTRARRTPTLMGTNVTGSGSLLSYAMLGLTGVRIVMGRPAHPRALQRPRRADDVVMGGLTGLAPGRITAREGGAGVVVEGVAMRLAASHGTNARLLARATSTCFPRHDR
jgi:hypothetical protein